MTTHTCPVCEKTNEDSSEDGYVEGPREYHAECWGKLSGTLHDYDTAAELRRATVEESQSSIVAARSDGGAGVILVTVDGDLVEPSHRAADDARRCYVVPD